ncbi:hypothetical protein LB543_01420 [Mesorhizobium sp. ESP7-2]|uniref:phage tail tape measure protein n=1 Tax=Mesorhizobium sp. ESP7-2 TaxID=2876622 RepID=UPI001CCC608C|nr:phage tail tape measure protein [Mesorhizobium sp. ESP7-2]MBZ9705388.1 hypothetical protein [Mesorhizobium sp. ESP7-2]
MAERNAIAVLIKLLGGEVMIAELEKLGTTGEKAMATIQDSAKKVEFGGLGHDLSLLIGDIGTFAARSVIALGTLKAAADGVGAALFFLAKSGAEAAVQANNAAQAAGLSAKSYQEWAFAADSVGVSQEQVNTAFNTFNKQVIKTADETVKATGKAGKSLKQFGQSAKDANADITQGAGYTVQAFKDIGVEVTRFGAAASKVKTGTTAAKTGFDELGIKVKDASGKLKTNEQLLIEVANAFQKMPDGARKSQIALKLFGLEGAKLIPLLDKGAAGIEEFKKKAAELGIVFDDDQIKAALAFDDSLNELKKSISGLLRQIGLIAVPSFTAGFNAFRDIILRNKAAILDFARSGVATASVFLKDFFATLAGRDSEVTSNKWLISWRDAIKGFGEDFTHVAGNVVIPAMSKLREAADLTIKSINGIFGTNLTTGEVVIGATILRMVGGFQLLRTAIFTAINAISLLSTALISTPAGRIILGIAVAVEGLIAVWDRERSKQQAWIAGTDAHKNALNELKAAIDAVKAGVPGAEENLKRLAQAHLDSARAALEDAKAQVAQQQQIVDAMKQGGDFAAPLGADIDTQTEALLRANINLAKRTRELDEVQKTIDGKVVGNIEDLRQGTTQAATGMTQLGAAADTTAAKVGELDHQINVFRGGGPGGSLSKEVFDVVDGVAHRADQSKAALDGVAASAQAAGDHVKTVGNEVKEALTLDNGAGAGLSSSVGGAVDSVVSDVKKIKPAADEAATGLKNALDGSDAGGLGSAISDSVDGVVTNLSTLAPAADDAVGGLNSALANIDTSGAQQSATAIAQPFQELPSLFSQIFSGLGSLVQGGFSSLSSVVASLASQIRSQISQIIAELQAAVAQAQQLRAQASSSSSDGGGSHGGFAGGGDVVGAGTGTSDSILAWLSNGEFVNRAAAVAYYGRDIFHALNNMTLPKNFLRSLRGFNLGGAVETFSRSMAIPRYAGGGLASMPLQTPVETTQGRTPFMLQLPGGEVIDDLTIGDIGLRRLQTVSLRGARVSAGRAPRRGG